MIDHIAPYKLLSRARSAGSVTVSGNTITDTTPSSGFVHFGALPFPDTCERPARPSPPPGVDFPQDITGSQHLQIRYVSPMTATIPGYLTAQQAADHLGISIKTIYNLNGQHGDFPPPPRGTNPALADRSARRMARTTPCTQAAVTFRHQASHTPETRRT
ncbi:hypothetical protein O1L60_13515 [Streptomyces diastatochromogenes]|nr:hypothetical protein [Streptomyces diastatochromogenes]